MAVRKTTKKKPVRKIRTTLTTRVPKPSRVSTPPPALLGMEKFAYLLVAWLVVMAGLLAFPNYNLLFHEGNAFIHYQIQAFPPDNLFARLPGNLLVTVGFISLVVLFRLVPPVGDGEWDIPGWAARAGFWFMVWGLLHLNPHQLNSFFWDDHYLLIPISGTYLDFHRFIFSSPLDGGSPSFPT